MDKASHGKEGTSTSVFSGLDRITTEKVGFYYRKFIALFGLLVNDGACWPM